jgi:hypothetical protein
LLAFKALCHASTQRSWVQNPARPSFFSFFTNSSIFSYFSSNFNNFF